jgi:signal transduction histidine kinase
MKRMEEGSLKLILSPKSVAPIVEAVVQQYTKRAEAKSITLHFSNEAAEGVALVEEQTMVQIFDNLVSNAVKYSPHGQQVWVRFKAFDNTVRVEIQDEGPGISAEDRAKLFGKFVRLSAQPTGGEHSTGLGLSIVKKLVEAMNGRVWCESELGKGVTFVVELPNATFPEVAR